MIMLRTVRTRGGAIGIIEFAGMRTAHLGKDAVQRLHARRAIFQPPALGQGGDRKARQQSHHKKRETEAHGHFLAFFK